MAWPLAETTTNTGVTASQEKQLHDGNPDGMLFGRSTDYLSFFGATPTTQPYGGPTLSSTASNFSSTGGYGLSTSTLAAQFALAVSDIQAALKILGLIS